MVQYSLYQPFLTPPVQHAAEIADGKMEVQSMPHVSQLWTLLTVQLPLQHICPGAQAPPQRLQLLTSVFKLVLFPAISATTTTGYQNTSVVSKPSEENIPDSIAARFSQWAFSAARIAVAIVGTEVDTTFGTAYLWRDARWKTTRNGCTYSCGTRLTVWTMLITKSAVGIAVLLVDTYTVATIHIAIGTGRAIDSSRTRTSTLCVCTQSIDAVAVAAGLSCRATRTASAAIRHISSG